MNGKEQAAGEKRVQELLIAPLEALGLTKPGTMRKEQFETMKKELRQMLAYMKPANLQLLCEWCEGHPGGKDRDRFPIALHILKEARRIEPPETGPSPLMLEVFGRSLGQEAIAKGWAPELLTWLKGNRAWPGNYTVSQIKAAADDPVRRLEDIEARMARGRAVTAEEVAFRDRRRVALQKCRDIADEARAQRAVAQA
ncbi:hypothetical protein KUV61_04375 [Nocardioides marinus]|nr:hypothetical protein [Nocardioides marinus]